MTAPYGGRDIATLDPTSHRLPALTEATLPSVLGKGAASGLAALNASGQVVNSAGTAVTTPTDLAAQVALLQAQLNKTVYILDTVPATGPTGVYPARPNTPQVVQFNNPDVQPAFNGSLTGGGGMVPDHDVWWTGGAGVPTA